MSTNYYVRGLTCPNACVHCAMPKEVHIAQSAGNGPRGKPSYLLQAHDQDGPLGPIDSWTKWKEVLRGLTTTHPGSRIADEYGSLFEVEEFITKVEATDPMHRTRYGTDFRDNFGWAFSTSDFV